MFIDIEIIIDYNYLWLILGLAKHLIWCAIQISLSTARILNVNTAADHDHVGRSHFDCI